MLQQLRELHPPAVDDAFLFFGKVPPIRCFSCSCRCCCCWLFLHHGTGFRLAGFLPSLLRSIVDYFSSNSTCSEPLYLLLNDLLLSPILLLPFKRCIEFVSDISRYLSMCTSCFVLRQSEILVRVTFFLYKLTLSQAV